MSVEVGPRPQSHMRMLAAAVPVVVYRGTAGGMPILLGLFIAHRWGLAELAAFTVANAVVSIAVVVADGGTTRALPRNLALLDAPGGARFVASANVFRLMLVGGMLVLGFLAAVVFHPLDAEVMVYLAILSPLCLSTMFTTNAVSDRVVNGDSRGIGLAVLAGLLTFATLATAGIASGLGPRVFVMAFVMGKMLESVVMVVGRRWVTSIRAREVASVAAALWPFSAQMILGVIYSRLAVFTAERMTSRVELGVFAVATALQGALLLVPASLALVHFPELTRRGQAGLSVRPILVRYAIISGVGVISGAGILAALSGPVSTMLKVPKPYFGFVLVFSALSLFSIFSTMAGFLMQSRGLEAEAARLSLVTLAFALGYQVAALRTWGLWGLVPAVAAAEITTLAIFTIALRRRRHV